MLLSRRLAATRRSLPLRLLPCTCRPNSTAAATAPLPERSSLPPRSVAPQRNSSLFTSNELPVIPPPLPHDVGASWTTRPSLSSSNSSHEQLAILSACLASGDITRAEEVIVRILTLWRKTNSSSTNRAPTRGQSLATVLGPKVHAEFLRAYFYGALVQHDSIPRTPKAATMQRDSHIAKAWSYLEDLLQSRQWEVVENRKVVNLAVDASVFAVMLKGLTALQLAMDPVEDRTPVTALLDHMEKLKIGLYDVLKDQIFDVELPSRLGPVSREEVLDLLEKDAKDDKATVWNAWQGILSDTRTKVLADKEGSSKARQDSQRAEILPTEKGEDISAPLKTLRTNLMTLNMPDNSGVLTPTARQSLLEESSYDAARQLYIHEMEELAKVGKGKDRGMQGSWLQGRMFEWLGELHARLAKDSKVLGKAGPWGKDQEAEPFMRLLPPDKMALITIVELLRLCGGGGVSDGMKAARAVLHVGRAIENEHHANLIRDGMSQKEFDAQMEALSEVSSDEGSGVRSQERSLAVMWRREFAERQKKGEAWTQSWTQAQRAKVGSLLVTSLMETAFVERVGFGANGERVTEKQPAFSHSYQFLRGNKIGVIKVNPVVAQRMDQDPLSITLHPRFLPMIVKPKPWLSYNSGCYLKHSTLVMRTKDSHEQIEHLKQASHADTLDRIFSGLDVLGSVSWKINAQVFDVVSQVWNTGSELADIPAKGALEKKLEVEKAANYDTDPRAKDNYRQRVKKALQEQRSAHSNRCDVNYKLEIARAFHDETFYFPHNLDFRGRAYPIPPNLSHIGNDLCRGILKFGEAKPLGERGLRWLKIHLANVRGFDKASFDEREAYAMEHLDEVYDSADNPLNGRRWWLEADDPWQCLATCFELSAALRSPVPIEFMSSLPIHQDGTCNGLQHYAALGGDIKGASQVNLAGGDRPSDVYSGVAAMANEVIDRDAAEGNAYALMLQGKVTRKVVKQTVMTTVYGVTFIGAKKQIQKQLKERGDIPAEHLYMAALYLGRIVLDSIGDVFKGATAIQNWLHRSARLIAKSIPPERITHAMELQAPTRGGRRKVAPGLSRIPKEQMTSVIWNTPLGLPVVQPYRKAKKRQIPTVLQSVSISDPGVPAEVDPRAQATAFPPNFIHSLDATHMMMTALACKDKIAFASVHDSYWTHACSVDEMSILLRDAFIELHSTDILGQLRADFLRRYAGHVVPVAKLASSQRKTTTPSPIEEDGEVGESDSGDDVLSSPLPQFGDSNNTEAARLDDATLAAKGNATKVGTPFVDLADLLPPVPSRGDFDLNRIRDSLYFFS